MDPNSISDYIDAHIDAEPPVLRALYRRTHLTRLYPRMCTDNAQGRLLSMLTHMIRPKRILELGTFSGYSTLCFAMATPPECTVDTVEIDSEHAPELVALFEETGFADQIHLHTADALAFVEALPADCGYDMVFVDADKRAYPQYYTALRRVLKPGAFILADNTLWDGKVTDPSAHDPQTEGIRAFNRMVGADPGVEKVIVPVRDGLTIIRIL